MNSHMHDASSHDELLPTRTIPRDATRCVAKQSKQGTSSVASLAQSIASSRIGAPLSDFCRGTGAILGTQASHRICNSLPLSLSTISLAFCAGDRSLVGARQKSIQSSRFVGGAPEDAVELTVVVEDAEDVDGSDDSRSNISHRV